MQFVIIIFKTLPHKLYILRSLWYSVNFLLNIGVENTKTRTDTVLKGEGVSS